MKRAIGLLFACFFPFLVACQRQSDRLLGLLLLGLRLLLHKLPLPGLLPRILVGLIEPPEPAAVSAPRQRGHAIARLGVLYVERWKPETACQATRCFKVIDTFWDEVREYRH